MGDYNFDYVIVGAGPCGLTLAYIINQYRPGKKILLMDRERALGGCHRVRRTGGDMNLFTEHGPRIYLDNYLLLRQILTELGTDFYQEFVRYHQQFANAAVIGELGLSEITTFVVAYIKHFVNADTGRKVILDDWMIEKGFSDKIRDLIDRTCRVTDGAGADRYTLWEFLELLNQNALYTVHQPKLPTDQGFIKKWTDHLYRQPNITIWTGVTAEKLISSGGEHGSIVGLTGKGLDGTPYQVKGNMFLLAVPPKYLIKLLADSGEYKAFDKIRDFNFGEENKENENEMTEEENENEKNSFSNKVDYNSPLNRKKKTKSENLKMEMKNNKIENFEMKNEKFYKNKENRKNKNTLTNKNRKIKNKNKENKNNFTLTNENKEMKNRKMKNEKENENENGFDRPLNMSWEKLVKWEEACRYLNFIPITYHWVGKKFPTDDVWGMSEDSDWGIVFIVLSDYMTFPNSPSKTVISVAVTRPFAFSRVTGKSANQSNTQELLKEVLRQMTEVFPKIAVRPPDHQIISPGVYRSENGSSWETLDSAFQLTTVGFGPRQSTKYPNLYSVGTHNGYSKYGFTSAEAAIQNAVSLCHKIVPESREKYQIGHIWTLKDLIIGLAILIVIGLIYYYYFRK